MQELAKTARRNFAICQVSLSRLRHSAVPETVRREVKSQMAIRLAGHQSELTAQFDELFSRNVQEIRVPQAPLAGNPLLPTPTAYAWKCGTPLVLPLGS